MKKRILSFVLCAVMLCMMAMALPDPIKAEAGVYPPNQYQLALRPGEKVGPYHPAMRDKFTSYSNTNSSVADIEYTDPDFIYIVAKNPGTTLITLYAEWIDFEFYVTVANPQWDQTSYTVRVGDTVVATLDNYTSDCVFSDAGNGSRVQLTDHKNGTVSITGLSEGNAYLTAVNQFGYEVLLVVTVVSAEPSILVPEIVMQLGVPFTLTGGGNAPIDGDVYNIKEIQSYHKMLGVVVEGGRFVAYPTRKGDYTLYIKTFTGRTLTVPVRVV